MVDKAMLVIKVISKPKAARILVRSQFEVNWGNSKKSLSEVSAYEKCTTF